MSTNKSLEEIQDEIVSKVKSYEEKQNELRELHVKMQTQLDEITDSGKGNSKLAKEITVELADQKSVIEALKLEFDEIRHAQLAPGPVATDQPDVFNVMRDDEGLQQYMERGQHRKGGHAVSLNTSFFTRPQPGATVIDSSTVGSSTPGIITPDRAVRYIPAAERRLTIREILPARPTQSNAVEYPKENVFTSAASPQTEGEAKAESALTFTIATANVRTIAHWIPASRQVLDDWDALFNIIRDKMLYGLLLKEEQEILSGSGTGQHLNGLVTQATAYDTARTNTNDNKIDFIRHALAQLDTADEEGANFIVVHPTDLWDMVGLKDQDANVGAYLSGSPFAFQAPLSLYGKALIKTPSLAVGNFLVGNSMQCEIFDRMDASVDISTEHSDYFTKNLVAIRVEERIALAVYRAGAFVTGAFTNASPL